MAAEAAMMPVPGSAVAQMVALTESAIVCEQLNKDLEEEYTYV